MVFTLANGYKGVFNLYFAGPNALHFAKLRNWGCTSAIRNTAQTERIRRIDTSSIWLLYAIAGLREDKRWI